MSVLELARRTDADTIFDLDAIILCFFIIIRY